MSPATQTKTDSRSSDIKIAPRSIRLLLVLWFLGGKDINQGEITKRIKLKEEKNADCEKYYSQLEKEGNILIDKKKVSITSEGINQLGQGLKTSDLAIEGTIVGAWMAKALLKWIQQSEVIVNGSQTNGKTDHAAIASYEAFKQVALEVYDRLNRDYNLDSLVPIYRIRREIGDKVSRSQFNEWMLELQANDILQLIGGEMPSLTPDIAEDSIETKLGGVRYYVKHL
jgi:hypothetical protein